MDGKLSLKGAWSGHVNHLNFGGHHIFGRAEARVVKFICMVIGYVKSQHKDDKLTNHAYKGRGQGHVTRFKF